MKIINDIRASIAVVISVIGILLAAIAAVVVIPVFALAGWLMPEEDVVVLKNTVEKFTDAIKVKAAELEATRK